MQIFHLLLLGAIKMPHDSRPLPNVSSNPSQNSTNHRNIHQKSRSGLLDRPVRLDRKTRGLVVYGAHP